MVNPQTLVFAILIFLIAIYLLQNLRFFRKKAIAYFLIPLLLFLGWCGLIIIQAFQIENVATILTDEYSQQYLISYKKGELYQGEKIVGEFKARQNYLGIVGFRFWTFWRLNDDFLIFRIREKGATEWYYQNKYKADQFQPNQYFTFGFPVIETSKGKTYIFEIESLQGRPGVAVGISEMNPVFIVKYKYPKSQVTVSLGQFFSFGLAKLSNLARKAEFNGAIFIYLTPLLLYLMSVTPVYLSIKSRLKAVIQSPVIPIFKIIVWGLYLMLFFTFETPRLSSFTLLMVGVLLDIFFVKTGSITLLILIILFWEVVRKYLIPTWLFFALAATMLVLSGFTYYFQLPQISERAGAWAWIFLVLVVFFLTFPSKNPVKTERRF